MSGDPHIAIETKKLNFDAEGNDSQGEQKGVIYRPKKKKLPRTYINILHDPRVVRGNTYAAFVIPSSIQAEFLRLKEEEERKKKLIEIPARLPRVALLAAKQKKDEYFGDDVEESTRPKSPTYNELEEPEEKIADNFYFYEDRPPTPKYVPKPPGVEVSTQIQDWELFDYDVEVEPILQVLVGRSLVQARYELIEDDERREFLLHKKRYEQKREFELINLQRAEAAYIRRQEEKARRLKQQEERKKYDIILQKKLISKLISKKVLTGFKMNILRQLNDRGFLW
jgi:hypothetical protein